MKFFVHVVCSTVVLFSAFRLAAVNNTAAGRELNTLRKIDSALSKTVKQLLNSRSNVERIHQKSSFNLHNNAYKTYMAGVLDIYNKVGAESELLSGVLTMTMDVCFSKYAAPVNKNNSPLYQYTYMPAHMRGPFSVEEMHRLEALAEPFSFTKGCSTMKIDASGINLYTSAYDFGHLLFDLKNDPHEMKNVANDPEYAGILKEMTGKLKELREEYKEPPLKIPRKKK
jgi:hypothetical protein